MRSLIILEVEHGEDTDALMDFAETMKAAPRFTIGGVESSFIETIDYTVRVDVPACFTL